MMKREDIYKWIKEQNGEVTIGQLIYEYSDADMVAISEGFNMYIESQIGKN
ncbi:hypothetical protein [Bacillus mycoides]|uniref:hypothetical protein n=1 Tax=Bacillus mycoides TaxID=1405 RepID=UPI0021128F65|nr:hypothetical protein [Bacillus mycoides]MCQ6530739.1 hypothetical protein [Bacillus mycoides]